MLLSPLCDGGELEEALRAGVILCIDSREGAEAAERAARRLDCTGKAQLCVDTGFGRYGFSWQQPQQIWEAARTLERLRVVGTYSHLRQGADPEGGETRRQEQRLTQVCNALAASGVEPGVRHLVESYGLLCCPESRLGCALAPLFWGGFRSGTSGALRPSARCAPGCGRCAPWRPGAPWGMAAAS